MTGRAAYPEGGENRKQKQGQPGIYPGAGEGILSANVMLFCVLQVVKNAKTRRSYVCCKAGSGLHAPMVV